jgi:plasmid stabilization system protein ParE
MTLLASSRPSRTAHSQRIAEHLEAYPARPELSKALRLCAHQRLIIVFSASPTRGRIERINHGCRDICDSRVTKG